MKVTLIHPMGNANVRAVAMGLAEAELLHSFNTSIAVFPNDFLYQLGSVSFLKELRRRSFESHLHKFTYTYPWYESGRLLASKLKFQSLIAHETGMFCTDRVCTLLDKKVSKKLSSIRGVINGVYAYEDSAVHSFEKAMQLGITRYYDLPTGYWRAGRKKLNHELEKHPLWANTITGFHDSKMKLERKDSELALANVVFVASSFTAKTLVDFPGKLPQIEIIPYGFPLCIEHRNYKPFAGTRKLKLLFVGKLSQQKGLANLLEAIVPFKNHVELTIVGRKPVNDCIPLNKGLQENNWIPSLPHHEILELMRAHDVLVFPSLFDGFGMVITEAMSQGTPVIASDHCAGPDLITHGKNGWLIRAGETESLQAQLEHLLQHPEQIKEVGKEAFNTATKRPWSVYGQDVAEAILLHSV